MFADQCLNVDKSSHFEYASPKLILCSYKVIDSFFRKIQTKPLGAQFIWTSFTIFLKCQSGSCIAVNGGTESSEFIKKIFICVPDDD